MQSTSGLDPSDLGLLLALVRGGTLARAAAALGVDASTVFRSARRVEQRLGQRLFERSRAGYRPTELALALAGHAERIEAELDAARAATTRTRDDAAVQLTGVVRLSTTDTLLPGLVMPALQRLAHRHPRLQFELHAGNEPVSLTRREADIALRATRRPPEHLVGRALGTIHAAVYGARPADGRVPPAPDLAGCAWVAPDDALPEHLSVLWRRRHLPRVQPQWRVNSILSVFDAVRLGLGVGIVPVFLAQTSPQLVPLTEPLAECDTTLWLLTHPESRHLRRIAAVAEHLAEALRLP